MIVGTIVLVLVAALAAGITWLTATRTTSERMPYKVFFARQSLEGLEVRSDVRMKGIRVGSVRGFRFRTMLCGGRVRHRLGTPVLQSTHAVVDRNFITGLATIRLLNLAEDSPPLVPPDNGDSAVIAEGSSQIQQFSENVNQLAQRADEALRRINSTLSDENVKALGETLDQLRVATREQRPPWARVERADVDREAPADAVRDVRRHQLGGATSGRPL